MSMFICLDFMPSIVMVGYSRHGFIVKYNISAIDVFGNFKSNKCQ